MALLPLIVIATQKPELPPFQREFRGVWVATVDNIDWPSKRDLTTAQQKRELVAIMDRSHELRLNAVIFQVRPSADALYNSKLEPWSEYLTGRQGKAPNPTYDPLEFAIQEARKRGLELHVWLNPYRAFHPAQKAPLHGSHISKTRPELVKTYGKYLWMDPGEPDVQKRSLAVVADILKRYDVDGIHIDDYFYPYPEKGVDFPDGPSYAKYQTRGGKLDRGDWRRKNVDDFVQNLYKLIKREKPLVKFGISPFGIYRPGIPEGIKAGVDQYAQLYADAEKWLREGWCDYFTPQLYWPVAQTPQSYPVLLNYWLEQNIQGRHIWPGNFTSRTNPAEGNWKPAEVQQQIAITRGAGATGNVHFSMKAFSRNWNNITSSLRGSVYREYAIPPATPWLDAQAPPAPKIKEASKNGEVKWTAGDGEAPILWALWQRINGNWTKTVVPYSGTTGEHRFDLPAGQDLKVDAVAVAAVDRSGNMSEPAYLAIEN